MNLNMFPGWKFQDRRRRRSEAGVTKIESQMENSDTDSRDNPDSKLNGRINHQA